MEITRIIAGIFTGILSVASGIYTFFTIQQKGPIFSNTYIWLSKKEREKADRKAEYRLVSVIFGGLSVGFLLDTLYIFFNFKWAFILMWIVFAFIFIYAIYDSIKSSQK